MRSDEGFFAPDSEQGYNLAAGNCLLVILFQGEVEKVDRICLWIYKCFTFWAQAVFSWMVGESG